MKKLIYTITALVTFAASANAQVGIETTEVSEKAILDFPDDADGGILLPYVSDLAANTVAGTVIYNATDGKIAFVDNKQSLVALTPDLKNIDRKAAYNHGFTETSSAESGVEISDNATEDTAPGVLILNSNTRALALPKVASVDDIESPKTGMICYDVSRRALAIYNGEHWLIRN